MNYKTNVVKSRYLFVARFVDANGNKSYEEYEIIAESINAAYLFIPKEVRDKADDIILKECEGNAIMTSV